MIFKLIGSLGLFLLGMWLLTEGLKMAGGKALETLLGEWTSTRLRALGSGVLITALVQSSSAVTVATIGFVNASLMSFGQAVWVVFGSNVGTTFTAWIVTFFGFSVNFSEVTFPLIGIGAGMRIFVSNDRLKALGMALAGFGLLFMGINELNENFAAYAHNIDIQGSLSSTAHPTFWALLIGIGMTIITQSSSAAIAIILTAVASGVADINIAAAAVIGANVGTTSTALFASLGASANAKRLALAHVGFNILTATVALLILPGFISLVAILLDEISLSGNIVLVLALFHTCFNLLGVILMWPMEPHISRWLLTLFQTPSGDELDISTLDANAATIPDLAIRTMAMEVNDLLQTIDNLNLPIVDINYVPENLHKLHTRLEQLNDFISLTLKSELTAQQGDQLTQGLSVSHYLHNAVKTFDETLKTYAQLGESVPKQLDKWFVEVNEFNHLLHHSDETLQREKLSVLKESYRQIKSQLIAATVNDRLSINSLDDVLQAASLARRYIEQVSQATQAYTLLMDNKDGEHNEPEQQAEAKQELDKENEVKLAI
jgi:phosphate:Na+ symporter